MNRILLLLLLIPYIALAQPKRVDSVFIKSIPAGLGGPIHMPELIYNQDFNLDMFFTYNVRQRVFTITEEAVYKKLFGSYIYSKADIKKQEDAGTDENIIRSMQRLMKDSVPIIDFSTYQLVVYSACVHCLEVCNHNNGEESCHRAVCNFREAWFVRKKT